jgi:hypothetical protein
MLGLVNAFSLLHQLKLFVGLAKKYLTERVLYSCCSLCKQSKEQTVHILNPFILHIIFLFLGRSSQMADCYNWSEMKFVYVMGRIDPLSDYSYLLQTHRVGQALN